MAKEIQRLRSEKRILELTTELFYREMKNNEIGFVTFVGCSLNTDSSIAKIGVSVYSDNQQEVEKALQALQKASGFFRSRIGKALQMRISPRIDFFLDDSLSRQARIDALLD